jgi:hypothetical protein
VAVATLACIFHATSYAQDVTVALWDFDVHALDSAATSGVSQYTRVLPELLTQELLSYPGARVVERSKLRQVLDEQKLGSSSLSDEDTRIRLGRLSGARHMVFGSALSIGPLTRLDVRLVSVETSRVEASFEISGTPAELPEQMGALAKDLATSLLGAALTQAQADAGSKSSAMAAAGSTPASASTLALFDSGLAQMDRKDFEGAVETFKKVLAQAPAFAPAERNIRTSLEKLSTQ